MLPFPYTEAETTDFLRRQVPALLAHLGPGQAPAWGQMTAQHMVEHLTDALRLSVGRYPMPPPAPSAALEQLRASLETDAPFSRNRRNPVLPALPGPLRQPSLAAATAELLLALDGFFDFYAQNPAATPVHMLFGALDFGQWRRFHFKHFAHHFEQFALLDAPLLPRPAAAAAPVAPAP